MTFTPRVTGEARYSSNVNQSSQNPLWDVILSTRLQLIGDWPVTRFNTLDFSLGAGYERYLRNPELNSSRLSTSIVPDLDIEFSIRVTDYIRIQVREQLELKQDPTDAVGVDDSGNFVFDALQYNRLDNTVSATTYWDVNSRTVTQVGLRRNDIYPLDDLFETTRRIQETMDWLLQRQMGTRFSGGLSAAYTRSRYRQGLLNDGNSTSAGVFMNSQITPRINLLSRVSHSWQSFSAGGEIEDSSQPRNLLWSMQLRHTPEPRLTYTATVARSTQFGFTANTTVLDNYGLAFVWTGFRLGDVRLSGNHTRGRDSGGVLAERYTRNSIRADFAMEIGANAGLSLRYQFSTKDSNRDDRDYDQHIFGASVFYQF
ncbi:MAG: hypothetical protein JJU20_12670 [Opitutales bacterium]|nr:hypothetical protein [Opitutales bacterium]